MKKFNFIGYYIRKPISESQVINAVSTNKFKKLTDADLSSRGFIPFHIDPLEILDAENDVFDSLNCYQHFDDLLLVKYTVATRYPSVDAVEAELKRRLLVSIGDDFECLSDEDKQRLRESITYELGKITPITCLTMFCALDLINQRCYFAASNEKNINLITYGLSRSLDGFTIQHFANCSDNHISESLTDIFVGGYDRYEITAPYSALLLSKKSFIDAEAMDHIEVGACAHLQSSDKYGPAHKLKNACLCHKDYRQHLTDSSMNVIEIELEIFDGVRGDLDDPFSYIADVQINNKWIFRGVSLTDNFEAKYRDDACKLSHIDSWYHDELLQAVAMHKITGRVLAVCKMPKMNINVDSVDVELLDDQTI